MQVVTNVGDSSTLQNLVSIELFLNKLERNSKAQPRCQYHHPQNQLCDCGRYQPKCYNVSYRRWHVRLRYELDSRLCCPPFALAQLQVQVLLALARLLCRAFHPLTLVVSSNTKITQINSNIDIYKPVQFRRQLFFQHLVIMIVPSKRLPQKDNQLVRDRHHRILQRMPFFFRCNAPAVSHHLVTDVAPFCGINDEAIYPFNAAFNSSTFSSSRHDIISRCTNVSYSIGESLYSFSCALRTRHCKLRT